MSWFNRLGTKSNNPVIPFRDRTHESPCHRPLWKERGGRRTRDSQGNYRYLIALNPQSFLVWLRLDPRHRFSPVHDFPSSEGSLSKRRIRPKKKNPIWKSERLANLLLTMLVWWKVFAHLLHRVFSLLSSTSPSYFPSPPDLFLRFLEWFS